MYGREQKNQDRPIIVVTNDEDLKKVDSWSSNKCPNTGILRWASNQASHGPECKLVMFPAPMNYDSDYRGIGINERTKFTWKNSCLWGVTHQIGHMYVIMFSPRENLITWRLFTESDCGVKFGISRDEYLTFSEKYRDNSNSECPGGFLQNGFISRILEQLITSSLYLYLREKDAENAEDISGIANDKVIRFDKGIEFEKVSIFFSRYRLMKVKNIKHEVCDNLTKENKGCVNIFVGALSMMDSTLKWENDGESRKSTIFIIGTPNRFTYNMNGRLCVVQNNKYEFPIEIAEADFRVEGSDFHWFVRGLLHHIEDMFERKRNFLQKMRTK